MPETLARFGAAGKVGTRIADKLQEAPQYNMLYVERGEAGMACLQQRGLKATPPDEAVKLADIVVLAVPDSVIGSVAAGIVRQLKSGALVVCRDPAAPHAGELPGA